MAAADGSVIIEIKGDAGDFTAEVSNVSGSLNNAGKSASMFGDMLKAHVIGDAIIGGVKALGNAISSAVSGLVDFAKSGIDTASDLEEVQNVVDVTFGEGASQIEEFAKSAANSFGMTELSAKQMTGTMGSMLKSMGMTDETVLDMSTAITGLAGDMASFYNLDAQDAFNKLRAGISGETEPLKQLGINMSVANLEAYALSQGITTAFGSMTQAEQATLRYNYLMQATADAQGDFARTADSYANQQRILKLNMENLGASIGKKLLPTITSVTSAINSLVAGETDMEEFVSQMSGIITDVASSITAQLPVLTETAVQILVSLVSGLQSNLPMIMNAAISVIGALVSGISALLPMLAQSAIDIIMSLANGLIAYLPSLIAALPAIISGIVDFILENLPTVIDTGIKLLEALADGILVALPDMIDRLPEIITKIVGFIAENLPKILSAGASLLLQLATGIIQAIPQLVSQLPAIIVAIVQGLLSMVDDIKQVGKDLIEGLWNGIKDMSAWVKSKVKGFCSNVLGGIKDFFQIQSPSKVMNEDVGVMIARGLGEGMTDGTRVAVRDAERMAAKVKDAAQSELGAKLKTAVGMESEKFSAQLAVKSTASADEQSAARASQTNAVVGGLAAGFASSGGDVVLSLNGIEFGRAFLPSLRAVESQSPQIVSVVG